MELGSRKTIRLLVLCLIFGVFFAVLTSVNKPTEAATGTNQTVNFQGRLLNTAGATVPDGYYNLQFKIYQDGDGLSVGNTTGSPTGSLKWTESYLNNNTQGVRVQNGYFSVQLGSITAFGSSVDWNQSVLWLSMNVGNTNASCTPFTSCSPDGEMVPMQALTSAVYALNSNQLGGLTASQFGQLAGSQTFTGANIFQPTTNVTAVKILQNSAGSPTADIFNVQSANGTNLIQVTGPSANNAAITLTSLGSGNAITLNSAGAVNITGSGSSTWDIGNNTLSVQTTNNGAITTGTGLLTVGGNLTFSGTSARTITGPTTGGLTITDATGPITISTTGASGTRTLALNSAGALNVTAAAASTWDIGNNILSLQTTSNGNITTGTGLVTLGGNQSFSAAAPVINATTTNAGLTVQANGTGTLTLNTSGSGTVNLGTTNSTTVNIGNATSTTGVTTTGGASVWTVNNTGTVVKTNTNSTTAFLVQNSGSSSILGVNTSTPQVSFTATSAYATNGVPLVNTSYTSINTTAAVETAQQITVSDTGVATTSTDETNGLKISVTRTGANGASANTYGINIGIVSDNAGAGTANAYGVYAQSNGTGDNMYGVVGSAVAAGTQNPTSLTGVQGTAGTFFFTGTATTAVGVSANVSAIAAGTFTTGYGIQVTTSAVANGGAIGTVYGLQVQPQSIGGTANYGAAIGTASTQTLWLGYDTNTSYGANTGIAFGSASDSKLYRSAANTLKTDSSYLIQTTTNSNSALSVSNQAGTNIFNVDSINNFSGTVNTTTASTNSQALALQSGTASGSTSNSGAVSLKSGDSNTSGNTGALSLLTGSAVSGNSGAINIDVGTPGGAGTAGAVTIGTSNTRSVGIGNTTAATTTSISGGTGSSAVAIQAGSGGTLSFGTGGVANTIQIGTITGGVTQTIGIGNNATSGSINNITIGNLLTSSNTAIQGGTGSSAITLTQGTGGGIVIGGTGAASTVSIQCGAGTSTNCGFANNATDHTTVLGSTTGTSATTIQSGSGGLTLTGNISASGTYNSNTFSSTALTFSGANPVISASTTNTGMSLQANGTGTLALTTTGAGTVNLGTTGATTIAIGNSLATTGVTVSCGSGGCGFGDNATAHTTTLGSTTGTASTAIQSGTGNLTIQTQGTGTLGIGNNAVAQNLAIGNGTGATTVAISCGSGACGFGNNAIAHATTVGTATGNAGTTLQAGTGGINIETQGTGAIAIGNNAVAQTVNIGNSTGATNVSVACGTGACGFGDNGVAHTTTIGSNTGTATTLIQSGTGNLSLQTQGTGTLGIGNNAVAQTINIGNATGATAVAISCGTGTCGFGNNATDHSTTVGSVTGTSLTTIQGGSGGVTINGNINAPGTINTNTFSSAALTFAGASPVISASTTNTGITLQANGTGILTLNTTGAGTVNVGTSNTTTVAIGNGTGATTVSVSCGTGVCGFGNNATDHSTTVGSTTGTSATTIQSGSGGLTLTGNITASGTYNTNTFNSTTLTFAGASPTISASTTNTGLMMQANGTGTLTLNTTGAGAVNMGTTNTTVVSIGNGTSTTTVGVSCGTGICGFGNNATDHSTTVGSATGVSATTIQGGTGGVAVKATGTAGFSVQNASGTSVLVVDTTNRQLRVMENAGTTNYALVYYDTATSTANYTANSGTVAVGTGAGAISVVAGSGSAITITANAASLWRTTAGTLTLQSGTNANLVFTPNGTGMATISGSSKLVLGQSAGDPGTCTAGAIVYNTSSNTLRGCQGSSPTWNDLINVTTPTIQSTYTASTGGTTAEIKLDTTRGALDVQGDNAGAVTDLFTVRAGTGSGLGQSLFDVNSSGDTTIQSSSGIAEFATTSTDVSIGQGSTAHSTNPVVLVLDNYQPVTAGSTPTQQDGAMYFNADQNVFMCGVSGRWVNCAINNIQSSYVFEDEFLGGTTSASTGTSFQGVGALGWNVNATTACAAAYNQTGPALTHDHPGTLRLTTGAANGNGCAMTQAGTAAGTATLSQVIGVGDVFKTNIALGGTLTGTMRVGWTNQTSNTAPTSGAYWEFAVGSDATHLRYCYANNGAATCAAGPTISANTWAELEIHINATNNITYIVNIGGTTNSYTTSNTFDPGTTNKLGPTATCYASTTTALNCYVDYIQWSGVNTSGDGIRN